MRLMKRCRNDQQVVRMRSLMVDMLLDEAAPSESETKLSYTEVQKIMGYIDTYWLLNPVILRAFIDEAFLNVRGYETTDNIVEGSWRWFDGE